MCLRGLCIGARDKTLCGNLCVHSWPSCSFYNDVVAASRTSVEPLKPFWNYAPFWSRGSRRAAGPGSLSKSMGFRGRSGEVGLPGVTSCEKSISRNHANVVLHSRFPPFGFVLKPVVSIYMVLGELRRNRVRASPRTHPPRGGLTSWGEGVPS